MMNKKPIITAIESDNDGYLTITVKGKDAKRVAQAIENCSIEFDERNCVKCAHRFQAKMMDSECWIACAHPNCTKEGWDQMVGNCGDKQITAPEWCPLEIADY